MAVDLEKTGRNAATLPARKDRRAEVGGLR